MARIIESHRGARPRADPPARHQARTRPGGAITPGRRRDRRAARREVPRHVHPVRRLRQAAVPAALPAPDAGVHARRRRPARQLALVWGIETFLVPMARHTDEMARAGRRGAARLRPRARRATSSSSSPARPPASPAPPTRCGCTGSATRSTRWPRPTRTSTTPRRVLTRRRPGPAVPCGCWPPLRRVCCRAPGRGGGMADTGHSKCSGRKACGFESRPRHQTCLTCGNAEQGPSACSAGVEVAQEPGGPGAKLNAAPPPKGRKFLRGVRFVEVCHFWGRARVARHASFTCHGGPCPRWWTSLPQATGATMRSTVRPVLAALAVTAALGCFPQEVSAADPAKSADGAGGPAPADAATTGAAAASTGAVPPPDHVVVVVMENHSYATSWATPSAVHQHARPAGRPVHPVLRHDPSEPAELPGAVLRLHPGGDDDSCPNLLLANLAADLARRRRHLRGLLRGPAAGRRPACESGAYARKHAPWTNFPAVPPGRADRSPTSPPASAPCRPSRS